MNSKVAEQAPAEFAKHRPYLDSRWVVPALVVFLTAAGTVERLLYFRLTFGSDWSRLPFPDEVNYYLSAARLIQQQGLHFFATERSLWNAPLNSLWILVWGSALIPVKCANLGLLACMGLLIWSIARNMFGSAAASVALALCSLQWRFAEVGFSILSESLFIFLLVAAFWLFCRRPSSRFFAGASGVVLGLATLTRPAVQAFPLVLLTAAIVVAVRDRGRLLTNFKPIAWFVAGCVAVIGPYILKNQILFHRPVIANSAFGAALYLGNNLKTDGDEPVYSGLEFGTNTISGPDPLSYLEAEGDRRLIAAALKEIREHPWQCLYLTIRKVPRYLLGYPESYFYPQRDLISALHRQPSGRVLTRVTLDLLTTVFAVIMGTVGLLSAPRGLPRLFTVALIGYLVMLHAATFAIPRLALPLYPFFALFAGAAAVRLTGNSVRSVLIVLGGTIVCVCWLAFAQTGRSASLVSKLYAGNFKTIRLVDDFTAWDLHDLEITQHGTFLTTGDVPYLQGSITPVQADRNEVFFLLLTIKPHCTADRGLKAGLVRWGSGSFADDQVVAFEALADGGAHIYRISPSRFPGWKGMISSIRLELPPGHRGTNYEIKYLSLAR